MPSAIEATSELYRSLLALTFLPSLIEALHDQADDHQDSSSRTLINGGDIERVT